VPPKFLKPLLAAIAFCALAACGGGQEGTTETKTYLAPDPLFYEIANADEEVEGWMLGTIHALPDGVQWSTPEIELVADEADLLIVEVASLGQGDTVRQAFLDLSRSPNLPAQRIGPLQSCSHARMRLETPRMGWTSC